MWNGSDNLEPFMSSLSKSTTLEAQSPLASTALQAYSSGMDFEWDSAKSEETRQERGFDFAFAALVFDVETIEAEDTRHDYGETRIRALGEAAGLVLVVIYTDRDGVRRIISARPANRQERTQWYSRG